MNIVQIRYEDDASYQAYVSPNEENICWNFPKYWKISPVSWGVKTAVTRIGESEDGWRPAYGGFSFVFRAKGGELPRFMAEKMTIDGKLLTEFSYEEFITLREKIKEGEG